MQVLHTNKDNSTVHMYMCIIHVHVHVCIMHKYDSGVYICTKLCGTECINTVNLKVYFGEKM